MWPQYPQQNGPGPGFAYGAYGAQAPPPQPRPPPVQVAARSNPLDNIFGRKKEPQPAQATSVNSQPMGQAMNSQPMGQAMNSQPMGQAMNSQPMGQAMMGHNGAMQPMQQPAALSSQQMSFQPMQQPSASNGESFGAFSSFQGPSLTTQDQSMAFQEFQGPSPDGFQDFQGPPPPGSADSFHDFQAPPAPGSANAPVFQAFAAAVSPPTSAPRAASPPVEEKAAPEDTINRIENPSGKKEERLPAPPSSTGVVAEKPSLDDYINQSFQGAFSGAPMAKVMDQKQQKSPRAAEHVVKHKPAATASKVDWNSYRSMLSKPAPTPEEKPSAAAETPHTDGQDVSFGDFVAPSSEPSSGAEFGAFSGATQAEVPFQASFGDFAGAGDTSTSFGSFVEPQPPSSVGESFTGSTSSSFSAFQQHNLPTPPGSASATFASFQQPTPPGSNSSSFAAFQPPQQPTPPGSNSSSFAAFQQPQQPTPPGSNSSSFAAFQQPQQPTPPGSNSSSTPFASFDAPFQPSMDVSAGANASAPASEQMSATDANEPAFGDFTSAEHGGDATMERVTQPPAQLSFAPPVKEEEPPKPISAEELLARATQGFTMDFDQVMAEKREKERRERGEVQETSEANAEEPESSYQGDHDSVDFGDFATPDASGFTASFPSESEPASSFGDFAPAASVPSASPERTIGQREQQTSVDKVEGTSSMQAASSKPTLSTFASVVASVRRSAEDLVPILVESLRFDDAAAVSQHVRAEKELDGLRARYKVAKDEDDLELALQLRKDIVTLEKSVLTSLQLAEIDRNADKVQPFALADVADSPQLAAYSLNAIVSAARENPVRAVELIKEAEQLRETMNAPDEPSDAVLELWRSVADDALRDMSVFLQSLRAASNHSSAAQRLFAENDTVTKHVQAIGRIVGVAMRCAFALEKFGRASRLEELSKEWRKLLASGGWRGEKGVASAKEGVFNEPKCSVCWNFIAPLDSVACLQPDIPNHVTCANLCANRYPTLKEIQ